LEQCKRADAHKLEKFKQKIQTINFFENDRKTISQQIPAGPPINEHASLKAAAASFEDLNR
jgi:hypothetical protein